MGETNLDPQSASTSSSLLQGIRGRDGNAWRRFTDHYTPLIYSWARHSGLGEDDAADVVQEVCGCVLSGIGDFGRDRAKTSFRGWLWAITRNQVRLHYRRQGRGPRAQGGSDAAWQLGQVADGEADEEAPPTIGDVALVHRALESIRGDFEALTWQAFWRMAVDGHSAVEIAADLDMTPSAVRQAKYRVLCRLRRELGDA